MDIVYLTDPEEEFEQETKDELKFEEYWEQRPTVTETVQKGINLREIKPQGTRYYDDMEIEYIKLPTSKKGEKYGSCSYKNSNNKRSKLKRPSTSYPTTSEEGYVVRKWSPLKLSRQTVKPIKTRKRCPLRLMEMAVPSKRQCLETMNNKCHILPGYMLERLRNIILDLKPIANIPDAITCFKMHKKRSKKQNKTRKVKMSKSQKKVAFESRCFCISLASGIMQKLLEPRSFCASSEAIKLSNEIGKDIVKIMHSCGYKDNYFSQKMCKDISNKTAVWISLILEDAQEKLLEDDLKDLEEQEGPVLDILDVIFDSVVDLCIPKSSSESSAKSSITVASKKDSSDDKESRTKSVDSSKSQDSYSEEAFDLNDAEKIVSKIVQELIDPIEISFGDSEYPTEEIDSLRSPYGFSKEATELTEAEEIASMIVQELVNPIKENSENSLTGTNVESFNETNVTKNDTTNTTNNQDGIYWTGNLNEQYMTSDAPNIEDKIENNEPINQDLNEFLSNDEPPVQDLNNIVLEDTPNIDEDEGLINKLLVSGDLTNEEESLQTSNAEPKLDNQEDDNVSTINEITSEYIKLIHQNDEDHPKHSDNQKFYQANTQDAAQLNERKKEDSIDEQSKKVKFSQINLGLVRGTSGPISSSFHQEVLPVKSTSTVPKLNLASPNMSLLSVADEVWPVHLQFPMQKASFRAIKAVLSLGKIFERTLDDRRDSIHANIENSSISLVERKRSKMSSNFVKLTESAETKLAIAELVEPILDTLIQKVVLHQSEEEIKVIPLDRKINDINHETVDKSETDPKESFQMKMKQTKPYISEGNIKVIAKKSLPKNRRKTSPVKEIPSRNSSPSQLESSYNNDKIGGAAPSRKPAKFDYKVDLNSAPNWVKQKLVESRVQKWQQDGQQYAQQWTKDMVSAINNLERWNSWLDTTCGDIISLKQSSGLETSNKSNTSKTGPHVNRKDAVDWVHLHRNIDMKAAQWARLSTSIQKKLNNYSESRNKVQPFTGLYHCECYPTFNQPK